MNRMMRLRGLRLGIYAMLCAALSGTVQAQVLSYAGLQDDAPERYTVVRGDTLWDISGRFLRHPWLWPEVWQVNPQIENPHLIYPGDVVYLYDCAGRPCLGLERGQGVAVLSPEIRRLPRREAIAPLPLKVVQNFLSDHRIVDDPERLEGLAYVVAGDDQRIVSGAGDRLYVRGDLGAQARYGIYRLGERYVGDGGDFLGQELVGVGEGRRLRSEGDITVLEVESSNQEVRSGDLVMPLESLALTSEFQPRAPGQRVEGHILAVPGGVQFIGRLQVVALDVGQRDGLAAGHVLTVEQQGELVADPVTQEMLRLPGVDAGLVMVFRVYDRVSYGLVMRATRSLTVGDRVHNPDGGDLVAAARR